MDKTKHIIRLQSKLYYDLYKKGGDKLIAVYCHLKNGKDMYGKYYSYTAKNNKKVEGLAILRKFTSLSLHTLKKYVPLLIELDLCFYDKGGNFCVRGSNKLNIKYAPKGGVTKIKFIPISLGNNINDTALSAYFVRVHSNHKQQGTMIKQKLNRHELNKQLNKAREDSDYYLPPKAIKNALKQEQKFDKETLTATTVASNDLFSGLKDNTRGRKQRGSYWKKKLIKRKLISSKQRLKRIEKMSYENYRFIRNHSLNGFKLSYRYGYLLEQLPNSLFIINSTANYFSRTSKDLLTITKLKKKRSGNAIVGKK